MVKNYIDSCISEIITPVLEKHKFKYDLSPEFHRTNTWIYRKQRGQYTAIINIYVLNQKSIDGSLYTNIPLKFQCEKKISELMANESMSFFELLKLSEKTEFTNEEELREILIKFKNILLEKGIPYLDNLLICEIEKAIPSKTDYEYLEKIHSSAKLENRYLSNEIYLEILGQVDQYREMDFDIIRKELVDIALCLGDYIGNIFGAEWGWRNNKYTVNTDIFSYNPIQAVFNYWRDKRSVTPIDTLRELFQKN